MPWGGGRGGGGGKKRQPGRRVHGEREGITRLGTVRGQKMKSQNFFMTHEEREDVIFDVQIIFIWPPCKHLKA